MDAEEAARLIETSPDFPLLRRDAISLCCQEG
jgi:hypothetical protein